jgi:hypothetical protein
MTGSRSISCRPVSCPARLPSRRLAALLLGFMLAEPVAHAQDQSDPETLRSGLTEMLSLLSFGSVSVPDQAVQVTQSGAGYLVQLPLSGFAAPAGASAQAVAHPAPGGAWDITSMTIPSAGALGTSIDQVVSYTLGQQALHGRLDPNLTTLSTFVAELGAIELQFASGRRATEQTIGRMVLDGTLSASSDSRLDVHARDAAANWRAKTRDTGGIESFNIVQRVDGNFSVNGLDRARSIRLLAAARSLMGAAKSPDRGRDLSPAERHGLRDMLDATAGLLTRIEADETLDGVTFDLGGGNAGRLGRIQMQINGSAEAQRLNAGADVAIDELSLNALSADTAAFLPHHLTARSVLAGIPIGQLMALLQAAIAPNPDQAALQAQAASLLNAPGARAAIESIAFDSGPLHVRGSAHFLPRPNGEVGIDIHISASGADALLVLAQRKPSLQGVLPMVFLAKGMGRVQGDSIVWDISLGGGPLTINGVPFGQPGGRSR